MCLSISNGFVDPDDIKTKIKSNTRLVIVNHASNVIGTVQPLEAIGRICREHDVVTFAIDASQSAGKVPIDIEQDAHRCRCIYRPQIVAGTDRYRRPVCARRN